MNILSKDDYLVDHDGSIAIDCEAVSVVGLLAYCFVCSWTGTLTGTLRLQVSNDKNIWHSIDSHAMGGAAGDELFNQSLFGYKFARIRLNGVGGAGVLNISVAGK